MIMLHCEQHTGYAIGALENVFEKAALQAGYAPEQILWSYPKVFSPGASVFELGYYSNSDGLKLEEIHRAFPIDTILAFDIPYPTPLVNRARKLGISNIVSYWGGSMSSLNQGLKLFAKRLEWYSRRGSAPDLFVFESEAMRLTATQGRGIPEKHTVVVPLGVETNIYKPDPGSKYAHDQFGIPKDRKIIFYSGHMEERKGVRVLIETMNALRKLNAIEPFHLLICGNKGSQSAPYEALISDSKTRDHVTFGGYRDDVPALMQSSFLGVIASTGWDSFTMSSVEMMACGLPLIVSDLQGLRETTVPYETGMYIKPGNFEELANTLIWYHANPEMHYEHSEKARQRVLSHFSVNLQVKRLSVFLNSKQEVSDSIPGAQL